jgi:hypothetical protein
VPPRPTIPSRTNTQDGPKPLGNTVPARPGTHTTCGARHVQHEAHDDGRDDGAEKSGLGQQRVPARVHRATLVQHGELVPEPIGVGVPARARITRPISETEKHRKLPSIASPARRGQREWGER